MKNVLLVIPSLDYGGASRQLTLLATGLPRERFHVRVCVLGGPAAWVDTLRQSGVTVDLLGWKRPFDVVPFLALRKLMQSFQPDVVHVWGRAALAAVALCGVRGTSRCFASYVLRARKGRDWLGRWLLRHVDRAIAFGAADAECYRRLGLNADRVATVAPAANDSERGCVSAPSGHPAGEDSSGRSRDPARQILCIGPIEPHKGFRDAVWAFDILRYLYEDLLLVLAGDGSDRARMEEFARAAGMTRSVQITGRCSEVTPYLHRSTVVWVPGRRGGVGATLEAMAAGRPVVASRLPELAEIVVDGETGFLVPPGDKAALARQTRLVLEDADLARRFGEAGRRRAAECFPLARLIQLCAGLYERNGLRS